MRISSSAPNWEHAKKSTKKVMASVFWDAKGILPVEYLQTTNKIINFVNYCTFFKQMDEKSRQKKSCS